jgi:acetoin utilization deacetylase AcuC-like enzyme
LIFFPAFDWAISPTHPEREERLLYTRDQIFEEGIMDLPEIAEYASKLVDPHDIAMTHFCIPTVADQTTEAHLIAAGAAVLLADEVMQGNIKNGFALVRPPGHHSMRVVHGNRGFCNINNEAVMVNYLRRRKGIKRVAIIDTDVHHGDGTQDIFWHDPDVLFVSFHQDGRTLYPGTGFTDEMGGPRARSRTINIPLPPGTTDEGILYVMDHLILPILEEFKPDFIVNSAGQDNHYTDPLGSMLFSAQGYAKLTEKLRPDLAVLEGGYAIESALPYVNMGIIMALAGLDYSAVREADYRVFKEKPEITSYVHRLVEELRQNWSKRDQSGQLKQPAGGKFFERNRQVYYDTDNIRESQEEKLRACDNCPGYLCIQTSANKYFGRSGGSALCISVPANACSACQAEATDLYYQAKKNKTNPQVYLQDSVADVFLGYLADEDKEWRTEGR